MFVSSTAACCAATVALSLAPAAAEVVEYAQADKEQAPAAREANDPGRDAQTSSRRSTAHDHMRFHRTRPWTGWQHRRSQLGWQETNAGLLASLQQSVHRRRTRMETHWRRRADQA